MSTNQNEQGGLRSRGLQRQTSEQRKHSPLRDVAQDLALRLRDAPDSFRRKIPVFWQFLAEIAGGRRTTLLQAFVLLQLVFVSWGFAQERIVVHSYEDSEGRSHRFRHFFFLIFCSRCAALFLGLSQLAWTGLSDRFCERRGRKLLEKAALGKRKGDAGAGSAKKSGGETAAVVSSEDSMGTTRRVGTIPTPTLGGAPLHLVVLCALANVVSSFCGATSLMFISFSSHTIFKSGKVIFMMVIGTIIWGKQYTREDYRNAWLFYIGVIVFKLGEIVKKSWLKDWVLIESLSVSAALHGVCCNKVKLSPWNSTP